MNNDYIQKMLQNEKYLTKANELYDYLASFPSFRKRLDEIEKVVSKFAGNEHNVFQIDEKGFYDYARKHYIPNRDKSIVFSEHKALTGDKSFFEYLRSREQPDFLNCIALFGHLHKEISDFLQKHENDFYKLSINSMIRYKKLKNKIELLMGFLASVDRLVALFCNSVDTAEIEHLDDDIKNLDATAIKHRFMKALLTRNKSMCFKLIGRMRELDEGEDHYFEALAHYVNEEYDEAIRYIEKVNPTDIDYKSAIALKLECYSLMGDLANFENCVICNNQLEFNYWQLEYLRLSLMMRLDSLENLEANHKALNGIVYDESIDPYYVGLLFKLAANGIVELLEIFEMEENTPELDSSVIERMALQVKKIKNLLSIFPLEIHNHIPAYTNSDIDISSLKEVAESDILNLLLYSIPDVPFDNYQKAFSSLLKLGYTESFLINISENFDDLVKCSRAGEIGADELIVSAYIEGTVCGTLDKRIKDYVESSGKPDLSKEIDDKRIVSSLSDQGRSAYIAAEWQFEKSQQEDYGWKDAGMISLSYYRILEVEFNNQIVIPLLSRIGYATLKDTYENHANTLTGDDRKFFKKKWGTILKTYQSMEASGFTGNGFMLGELDYFFRAIGSEYDENDALGELILNNIRGVLNPTGIEKLKGGFFEALTKDETRNKYRNPPAHTLYLPYSVACECRELFRKTILQLSEMVCKQD